MTFTETFGGQTIYPSQLTLLVLTLTGNVTLQWPVEQAIAGDDVFADIIDAVSDVDNRVITMPDATLAGPGQATLINNLGAHVIIVHDNDGNVIGSVDSGEQWEFYLSDNTTSAGVWRAVQFGVGVSSATAAALAGAGLKAITTTLNVKIAANSSAVSPFVVVDGDRAKVVEWTGGVGDMTLPDPGVVGADWFCYIRNNGSGTLTITPTAGDIDTDTTLPLAPGNSCIVYTDGVDYFTIGLSQTTVASFDFTSINVAGSGDYTLTGPTEQNRISYKFTGALTGDRDIIVPDTVQQYWIDNQTSGAHVLTVKTSGGAGVPVPQGAATILYVDGTDVICAVGGSDGLIPVNQGGTGADTAADARTNLGVAFSAALVCKSGDQGIADNTETVLSWNTETTDVGGWHDNAVNNSRLTVPAGINYARFKAVVVINLDSSGNPYPSASLRLKKNNLTFVRQMQWSSSMPAAALGATNVTFEIDSGWLAVIPGDYMEILATTLSTGGVGSTIKAGSGVQSFFSAEGRA